LKKKYLIEKAGCTQKGNKLMMTSSQKIMVEIKIMLMEIPTEDIDVLMKKCWKPREGSQIYFQFFMDFFPLQECHQG